jgi:hypothetical protein
MQRPDGSRTSGEAVSGTPSTELVKKGTAGFKWAVSIIRPVEKVSLSNRGLREFASQFTLAGVKLQVLRLGHIPDFRTWSLADSRFCFVACEVVSIFVKRLPIARTRFLQKTQQQRSDVETRFDQPRKLTANALSPWIRRLLRLF